MRIHKRTATLVFFLLLTAARPGAAQGTDADKDPCGSPKGSFNFWLNYEPAAARRRGELVKLTILMPGLMAGLKIPVSVTFANRTELIDEKEVRGNVGFTVDLSKLQSSLAALKR